MPLNLEIDDNVFNYKYINYLTKTTRTQILFGGSSSGKSYSVMTLVPLWLLQGHSILILRKNHSSISKSVWLELTKSIHNLGLSKYFNISKTDKIITCKVSKGCIMTHGVYPDTEKLKSITPVYDTTFSKIILEEATEFSADDYNDILIRQRGKSKFKKTVMMLFNPIYQNHWIYKRFFKPIESTHNFNHPDTTSYESDELSILRTTYLDNRFLGQEEINTLQELREVSPYHYQVYALGLFGILGERVYDHYKEQDFTLEDINYNTLDIRLGVDFGFTNDPTTVVFTAYDETNKLIYVFDEIYVKGMFEEDLVVLINQKLKEHNIRHFKITADSAEPKAIKRMQSLGVRKTKKGADSIRNGIFWIKQHKLIVHPKCKNTLDELNLYTFKKDKNGEVHNDPVDRWNHCLDALRYAFDHIYCGAGKIIAAKMRF